MKWKMAVRTVPNTIKDPDVRNIKTMAEYLGYITDGCERIYIENVSEANAEINRRNAAQNDDGKNS